MGLGERKTGGLDDDDDLIVVEALVMDQAGVLNSLWQVTGLHVSMEMLGITTATMKISTPDSVGPLDVAFKAIDQVTGVSVELDSYKMSSDTEGSEVRCC